MKLFGKHDIWFFAGLIALALLIYAAGAPPGRNADRAEISVAGRVEQTVELSRDREFSLPRNPGVRFAVKDGAIAFIESDCPDKTCVRNGFLRRPGQMAACLPNRVFLTVKGADGPGAVDAVAG